MNCPTCHTEIPEPAVLSEAGRIRSARRKSKGAGAGRPRMLPHPYLKTCRCVECKKTRAKCK